MRTTKMLLICAFILPISFSALAQHKGDKKEAMKHRKEKVKAMKVSYITEKLALTTKEAEKFWPVYNEHEENLHKVRKTMRGDLDKKKTIEEMTDEEVTKIINNSIAIKEKELDLYKKYIADLKQILPVKKIAKLHRAEKSFKKELLKKKKKGGPNPANIPPPPPNK